MSLDRHNFREHGMQETRGECIVPWCSKEADEVHHIIERSLWDNGGYHPQNAAAVCNPHHRYAERNLIPPQAFWRWKGVEPLTPEGLSHHTNKWGVGFEQPPWKEHRERIKYPSTGHLPFSSEWDGSRVDHEELDTLTKVPLVITTKMDGSNAMLVKDLENPVRARNGQHAEHQSFDMLKQLYFEKGLYEVIPEHIQIFGEWLYAKHSIHYGCDGCCPEEDQGPALDSYFQVFGVYDTRYDIWLSWPETEHWANQVDFPTTPLLNPTTYHEEGGIWFNADWEIYEEVEPLARGVVEDGHEGIIIRSVFPFHYDQFEKYVGKYVRGGHVQPDEDHWKTRRVKKNRLAD